MLGASSTIGAYKLLHDFEPGANCRWSIASRDGTDYFVKEFHRPKFPPDSITGDLRQQKLARCKSFEDRHKQLVAGLAKVCAPGGNIVMPVDFFRLNLAYYHIAIKIDTTSLAPPQIAAVPPKERLLLLRLLARSLMTIHSQKIVHGDLKPSNILIKRSDVGILSPKLIDFDGSFFCGKPPDRADMAFDQNYMAPEILAYNKDDFEGTPIRAEWLGTGADIFSFGVLIHEYWTGRRPILPDGQLYCADVVLAGGVVKVDVPGLDPELQNLVKRALALDAKDRPAIEEIDKAIERQLSRLRSEISSTKTTKPVGGSGTMRTPRTTSEVSIRLSSFGEPSKEPHFRKSEVSVKARPAAPSPATGSVVIIRKSRNLNGETN